MKNKLNIDTLTIHIIYLILFTLLFIDFSKVKFIIDLDTLGALPFFIRLMNILTFSFYNFIIIIVYIKLGFKKAWFINNKRCSR